MMAITTSNSISVNPLTAFDALAGLKTLLDLIKFGLLKFIHSHFAIQGVILLQGRVNLQRKLSAEISVAGLSRSIHWVSASFGLGRQHPAVAIEMQANFLKWNTLKTRYFLKYF